MSFAASNKRFTACSVRSLVLCNIEHVPSWFVGTDDTAGPRCMLRMAIMRVVTRSALPHVWQVKIDTLHIYTSTSPHASRPCIITRAPSNSVIASFNPVMGIMHHVAQHQAPLAHRLPA